MLVDWYFSVRENDAYKENLNKLKIKNEELKEFEKTIEIEKLGKLYRCYDELKNHYRSVYVHLKGSDRKLIREKTDSHNQFLEGFDYAIDKDLYLLKEKSDEIKDTLDEKYKSDLKRYVSLL